MNKESVILAFPTEETNYEQKWASPGMDLRDYFAAKAIVHVIGLCTSYSRDAEEAYKIADAMLEARK